MADKKISALTAATIPLASTEVLPIVQSGSTVKVSVADLTAGRDISALSATVGNLSISGNAIKSTTTVQIGSTGGLNNTHVTFQDENINNANGVPVDGWVQTRAFDRWFMYGGVNGPGWRTDGSYLINQAWGSAAEFYFTANTGGVLLATGATSWAALSDVRLKTVIEPISESLNKIDQIQSFVYSFKFDENQKRRIGVSAQSVQSVVPEAIDNYKIDPDDTETYLSVRYTELVPLLIAGIQELRKEVNALKQRLP